MNDTFPVMHSRLQPVPWVLVAPHAAQAARNHCGQTLERLAERGGLDPAELVAVLEDRRWKPMTAARAEDLIEQKLKDFR